MGELEDKINKLLSSPEGLNQVVSMAKKLGGDGSGSSELKALMPAAVGGTDAEASEKTGSEPAVSSLGALPQLLNMDIDTLMGLAGLMGAKPAGDDKNTALLNSIKPYLKENRHEKIDKAVQMVKLAKLAKSALGSFGGGEN